MTMPLSGVISLSHANVELGFPYNTRISLGDINSRALADGVASGGGGAIVNLTISANAINYNVFNNVPGYVPGLTTVNLTIDPGVILSSANATIASLIIDRFNEGDKIYILNRGEIRGAGGAGGQGLGFYAGGTGGSAIKTTVDTEIDNFGLIYGGGGGGGGGYLPDFGYWEVAGAGGGGGAGIIGGAGGARGDQANFSVYGGGGGMGTTTTGGNGGYGSYGGQVCTGGRGGDTGQPGNPGTTTRNTVGGGWSVGLCYGAGGAAGAWCEGYSFVSRYNPQTGAVLGITK